VKSRRQMKMICRVAALLAVAHANLSTGIDDLSVSLLQTRAEKIHRPHQHKGSTKELLSTSAPTTGVEHKHSDHHSAEKHVSMGQLVKEKTGSDSADEFVKEDFTAKSDIAKLVHQVKVLEKDEAEVSKEVAKEVHTVKQNKQKEGSLDFLEDILGRPMDGKDVDFAQGKTHKEGSKDHLHDKVGKKKAAKEAELAEDLNLNSVEKDKQMSHGDENKGAEKSTKGHLDSAKTDGKGKKKDDNPLNFDVTEPASEKSEPKQVHFKGTELAKTAVHLDEMASQKQSAKLFEDDLEFHAQEAKKEVRMNAQRSKTVGKKTGKQAESAELIAESLQKGLEEAKENIHQNVQHSKSAEKETGKQVESAELIAEGLQKGLEEAKENIRQNVQHSKAVEKKMGKQVESAELVAESLQKGLEDAKANMHQTVEHKQSQKQLEASLEKGLKEAKETFQKNVEHVKDTAKNHLKSHTSQGGHSSLAKYHPGWKLVELEGGQQDNKPQVDEKQDLISEQTEQSDNETAHHKAHHKHRGNLVSEAMGAAFGDSDTAQIVAEDHAEAKLYSTTVAEDPDDTEEFWGEEEPSEVDREFTVEGIPMTSALGGDMETASLNKVDSHEKAKHIKSKSQDSMKTGKTSAVKDSHAANETTKSKTGSTLASTSHRRSRHLSQEEMCDSVSALDFSAATVTHSNLGGQGPDSGEETLVYSGITNQDGYVVDLVITATSPYAPRDAGKNGLQDDFGVINLEINSAVDLLFRFTSGGEPFVMNSFYFTFFDLDQGRAHEAREKATIRGFDSYRLSDGTSLEVEELGDSSAIFSSSMRGGKVDNPTSPLSLSHLQRERSVVVSLADVSEFSVQLSEENYASSQGRNWFFAGPSSIVCSRESKCSTYECPDGYHIRTMAEFLVCAGSPCTRHDRDTCCFEEEEEEEESESAELYSKSASTEKTKPAKTTIKSAKHY